MPYDFENYSIFALISGKPELRDAILQTSHDESLFDLLDEPILWEQVLQRRKGSLDKHVADEAAAKVQIKLTFLLYLWDTYILNNEASNIAKLVKFLLGDAPIHYTVFDKWWILSRPLHENSREVEAQLSAQAAQAFAKTGFDGLDSWLENLKNS